MGRITAKAACALLFVAGVAVAGCDISVGENGVSLDLAKGKASDEWVRSYSMAPSGRLEIINGNGTIDATGATGAQVEVRVERVARAGSDEEARALLQGLNMEEEASPQRVRIGTRGSESAG